MIARPRRSIIMIQTAKRGTMAALQVKAILMIHRMTKIRFCPVFAGELSVLESADTNVSSFGRASVSTHTRRFLFGHRASSFLGPSYRADKPSPVGGIVGYLYISHKKTLYAGIFSYSIIGFRRRYSTARTASVYDV